MAGNLCKIALKLLLCCFDSIERGSVTDSKKSHPERRDSFWCPQVFCGPYRPLDCDVAKSQLLELGYTLCVV